MLSELRDELAEPPQQETMRERVTKLTMAGGTSIAIGGAT
jgi:hypothetical protein